MNYQETSRLAFSEVRPKLGERQLQVLQALVEHPGQTNNELSHALGWPINTITPRVNELVKLKQVVEQSVRPCKISGRKAIAWMPKKELQQVSLF